MSTPRHTRFRTRGWRRVGFVAIWLAPILAAIPILTGLVSDGLLLTLLGPAWLWLLIAPPVLVTLVAIGVTFLRRGRERMPPLDPMPHEGTVVAHRVQSTGDTSSRRVTTVEYRSAQGKLHRADLLEELTIESIGMLPPGSAVEIYAFQDSRYARTAVFLTERHDHLKRQSAGSILWGVDRSERFVDGPVAGSPFLGADAAEVFAAPGSEAAERFEKHRAWSLRSLLVATMLIAVTAAGAGRLAWWSPITTTSASSGIGIGVTYVAPFGGKPLGEVAFVSYKLDGLLSYQGRIAAVSLADGALLWDRALDTDPVTGFPVAVTSVEQSDGDPGAASSTVVVTTERGAIGFYPDDGSVACGPEDSRGECDIEAGKGLLASTGEPFGDGFDLYGREPQRVDLRDGDTVLDPRTGQPAGDGFRIEYRMGEGARIIVGDETTAELGTVSHLQQVLVAPSGRVVLLMDGEDGKSMLVVASKDGFLQAIIGDRGLVAWPAWMG